MFQLYSKKDRSNIRCGKAGILLLLFYSLCIIFVPQQTHAEITTRVIKNLSYYQAEMATNYLEQTILRDARHEASYIQSINDIHQFLKELQEDIKTPLTAIFPYFLFSKLSQKTHNPKMSAELARDLLIKKYGPELERTLTKCLLYVFIYALYDSNNSIFTDTNGEYRFHPYGKDIHTCLQFLDISFVNFSEQVEHFTVEVDKKGNIHFLTTSGNDIKIFAQIARSTIVKDINKMHEASTYFYMQPDLMVIEMSDKIPGSKRIKK